MKLAVEFSPLAIDLNVTVHQSGESVLKTAIFKFLKELPMTAATDALAADVAAQKTVIASAVTLINGLPALVANAVRTAMEASDATAAQVEAALTQADIDVKAGTADLQAALTANTPTP